VSWGNNRIDIVAKDTADKVQILTWNGTWRPWTPIE
jgi:hypothetical protein